MNKKNSMNALKNFNNLSSKNPNQDEKRLWKRIVKTNPCLS